MFKKITATAITLVIIYFCFFIYQNIASEKKLESYTFSYNTEGLVEYDTIRCNINIFNPEFAFIDHSKNLFDKKDEYQVDFHLPGITVNEKGDDWSSNWTGGVVVVGTTFPELLVMIEDDCSRFQRSGRNGDVEWIYSKPRKETELSEEEKALEDKWLEEENKRAIREAEANGEVEMTDEEANRAIEGILDLEPGSLDNLGE